MLRAIVPVLERGKDMPVGQSQIGVRVHVARHIGKRSCDCGMQGIAEIEDEGCAGVVIVGKEHAAWRHRVLGVVHIHRLLTGGKSGHQAAVRRGSGIGVDDGEKGLALLCNISGPCEQVVPGCRSLLSQGPDGETDAERKQDKRGCCAGDHLQID